MRNPVDRIRQRLTRRRYRPRVPRRRAGTTAKLALFALVVIVGAGMVLELRGRS